MLKVLLTGHSTGLGAALAQALLAQGASVLALSRSSHPQKDGPAGATLSQVALDLSDNAALTQWLAGPALTEFFRGAERAVLINNAGKVEPIGPPGMQEPAAIAGAVALNVAAPLMLADAFVKVTAGCADRRLMHISSGAGRSVHAGWSIYCATKAALDHHARAVVADKLPGLRVESLAPGVVDTQMQAQIRDTTIERFPGRERFEAMKRDGALASPAQSAELIVAHLLSDAYGETVDSDIRQLKI